MISSKLRNKILEQSKNELDFAHKYKKSRLDDWDKNEFMVRNKKNRQVDTDTRTNIVLGETHKDLDTFLSKINNNLQFTYEPGELGDKMKVKHFNAIKDKYSKVDGWDMLDLLGKRESAIYGRVVYLAYGEQKDKEFKFNQQIISMKHFFIDPDAGGRDTEKAQYMGWYGLKMSKQQIESNPSFIKSQVESLYKGNPTTSGTQTKEVKLTSYDYFPQELKNDNYYYFYRWITTYEDKRYFLIFDTKGICIQCELWEDIQDSNMFPIWTWACYPEEFEFFSLGPIDLVREPEMAKNKTINQLMDNAEQINNPQKGVNIDKIQNLAEVKYNKKNTNILVTGDTNVNDAVQILTQPPITTGIDVYEKLDQIVQAASGITDAIQGVSSEKTLGIYQGNIAQANSRFALLQRSYDGGVYRLALLFREAVKQHFTRSMSIRVEGPFGLTWETVKAKDVQSKQDFDILVESSSLEDNQNILKSNQKIQALNGIMANPILIQQVNPKYAVEQTLKTAGFEEDELKQIMDVKNFTSEEIRGEMEHVFMQAINDEDIKHLPEITMDSVMEFNNLMQKYQEDLKPDQLERLKALVSIIQQKGMEYSIREEMAAQSGIQPNGQPLPPNPLLQGQPQGGIPPSQPTPQPPIGLQPSGITPPPLQ